MSLNARDPQFGVKLTAYALGELDGKDLKEVEEAVASNPSLQREVTAIREMVGTLTGALEREPAPKLTHEQRAKIAEGGSGSTWFRNFWAGHRMMLTRLVPAVAIGAIAFGYFGPFSHVLEDRIANAPLYKTKASLDSTPEAKSQPAVPPVPAERPEAGTEARKELAKGLGGADAGAAREVAPAMKAEQSLHEANQDKARLPSGPSTLQAKDAKEGEGSRRKSVVTAEPEPARIALAQPKVAPPAQKPIPRSVAPTNNKGARGADYKNADPADFDGAQMQAAPAEMADEAQSASTAPAPATPPAGVAPAAPAKSGVFGAGMKASTVGQGIGLGGAAQGSLSRSRGQVASNIGSKSKRHSAEKKKPAGRADAEMDDLSVADETKLNKQDSYSDNEAYDRVVDNEFKKVAQEPLSTFSIDVDTGSYSNLRRFLTSGSLPPKDAVRVEEFLNYFPYSYEQPKKSSPGSSNDPFAVNVEINQAPWNPEHRLVRIGLKGRELENGKRPPSNLVFLVDVSGSMDEPNRLPWVTESLKMLANQLGENDKVSIVVYAGNSGLLLPPTRGSHRKDIIDALEHMKAGGSTNGGQGIELAYKVARENFVQGGQNRVILCTDGDWNVGVTSQGDLTRLIEKKAKEGVFLSVVGFGMGNLKDATMVKLADKGHGHYAYIDNLQEAKKLFVEELGSTLVTIAKDVKIQVEFNPAEVNAFRLIGYEKRIMAHEDFNDDTKDAGIIGAGHTVTALYEVVPAGKSIDSPSVDPLKYQKTKEPSSAAKSGELLTLKLRYKAPEDGTSKLMSYPVKDEGKQPNQASKDYKFQSAIAAFGMLLRESSYKGTTTYDNVIDLAQSGKGDDKQGYRAEFIELVRKAKRLSGH